MPHSTESSCLWGKGTTWCTAATQSGNMFLNYTAQPDQNVVLYYIINKESDPKMDPNAKLSLGFINRKPVLDEKRGGVSVNAKNEGITEQDLKKILGEEEYNHIINLLKIHNEGIKGKHPAKEEIKNLALDYDGFMKKLNSFRDNEDYRNDFINIILKQENVNEKIFELLSEDKNDKVRLKIAVNPKTPVSILDKLSNDEDYHVRLNVALNPSTPEYILEFLSNDKSVSVRIYVARNPNTPVSILKYLSNDEDAYVRISVAENPNTPAYVLDKLSKDKDSDVRYWVAINKNKK